MGHDRGMTGYEWGMTGYEWGMIGAWMGHDMGIDRT